MKIPTDLYLNPPPFPKNSCPEPAPSKNSYIRPCVAAAEALSNAKSTLRLTHANFKRVTVSY